MPNSSEEERQERLRELLKDEPDIPERFGPGKDGAWELLDRAHLAEKFFQDNVLEHPACVLSEDLWRRACAIADLMGEFYQRVGEVCGEEEEYVGES
jgi:hypothetical protein